jgi:GT2 family glycosyltransferase
MSTQHPQAQPPVTSPARVRASVIVPCFNELAYTRLCVASLARHTRAPWELVAVDNGSDDGTAAYLRGVQDAAPFPVTVITNPENRGFPAACNQGLRAARGDYLVLLNNDAVVTDAWLDQLIALADSEPKIGMTGPVSNYASPPQLVADAPYSDLESMHRFAARWRSERRGRWLKAAKLSGFCLLIKRRALEAVGGLDEGFGLGLFDDDDLSLRVRKAGFDLAVALDLFVHHYGSRTFAGAGVDAAGLLAANRAKFEAKWGEDAPAAREVVLAPRRVEAAAPRRRCRVSLTMIVRDEAHNLPGCLGPVRGLFDEVVVVDTGSADGTSGVARALGARVFGFDWVDDFSAARNAALGHATGDYAFWLDADDRVEPPHLGRLRELFDGLAPGGPAYVVRCSCDAAHGGGATVVDHVRLFPLRGDVRWSYRVHEQILPALRKAGVEVRWSDAVVRHVGYNDPGLRQRKLRRDRAILEAEIRDRPGDPFVLFNLGQVALECGDPRGALGFLKTSLARSAPTDSITRKLHALVAKSHQRLGEHADALAACEAGLADDPGDAELLFRKGVLRRLTGRPAEAGECWRRVLTLRRPERFASVDEGIYGHVTRRNLAALAEESGDPAGAAAYWEAVLGEVPGDADALRALRRLRPGRRP